jgi:DNA-binding NarL/FixJ family response regulator
MQVDGRVRFLVICQESYFAEDLIRCLEEADGFEPSDPGHIPVSQAHSANWGSADLVLIDCAIGLRTTCELTRRITEDQGYARVVVVGVDENSDGSVADLVEAGATAYVSKQTPPRDLVDIARLASAGQASCSPRVAFEVFRRLTELSRRQSTSRWIRGLQLSPREVEILEMLAASMDNYEIAKCLFLSTPTVKNHVHRILSKMNVRNRNEAVALWADVRQSCGNLDPNCTRASIAKLHCAAKSY